MAPSLAVAVVNDEVHELLTTLHHDQLREPNGQQSIERSGLMINFALNLRKIF
jgi:hypothetical protein